MKFDRYNTYAYYECISNVSENEHKNMFKT